MKNNDTQLIQRVLEGDDTAFSTLVRKYQKSIHALAWRKIGDFHIAEDITQDTFLKAYQELSTLNEPQRFSSWLYVIASNYCKMWFRKKRLSTQSLEDTSSTQLERATYSGFVIEQKERSAEETQREIVKKLLAKLQESERTVMTLYYIGGMTHEEISEFLGVSVAAIKNRLYRARNRLKKEETMIRDALEHFQISPNLTDNIMQEISQTKQVAPTSGKPLIPWIAGVTAVTIVLLMLGFSNQFLSRFQKPYSLEAQSEMSVEIVEAPIVQKINAQPDVRRQFGNANAEGKNDTPSQTHDELLFAAADVEGENTPTTKKQWIQGNAPTYRHGPSARSLYSTPEGDVYIFINNGKFAKLPANGTEWEVVSDVSTMHDVRNRDNEIPVTVLNNTFYTVLSDELFSSIDKGKTWQSVGKRPQGYILDLVVIDNVFYLAMQDEIFRSTDIGKTWIPVKEGLPGEIRAIKVIQNTLFVSTRIDESQKLYRRNDDSWERLQFPHAEIHSVPSFAGTKDILYVMAALDVWNIDGQNQWWWIFRSDDKGDSWADVTPKNAWIINDVPPSVTLAAGGNTVLAIGTDDGAVVRSIDRGNSWTLKEVTGIPVKSYGVINTYPLDENTFYSLGNSGFLRSLDGGQSWNRVKIGEESRIDNLIWIKPDEKQNASADLYCMVLSEVYKSHDRGKSWQIVNPKINIREYNPDNPPVFTRINRSDDILYAKFGGDTISNINTGIFRISEDGNTFVPIQGMPYLDSQRLQRLLSERLNDPPDFSTQLFEKKIKKEFVGASQFFKTLANWDIDEQNGITKRELYSIYYELIFLGSRGQFAVSGDTFYMEYNYKLFRWRPGESEWYDTGVEETGELNRRKLGKSLELAGISIEEIWEMVRVDGFKLAVSENTIYVGKRDGKLVGSFDEGNNWIDFTPALPFPVTYFKEIVFAGNTVYVATNAGVAATNNGKNWHPLSDASGTQVKIDKLAADGNSLYGYSKKTGIYRLENGNWQQISSETLPYVNSLAVYGNTLYVGTMEQGMFIYNLEE
ncbi:sigma-70 family RNA polymerase sigma factor [Candidatus Poribacteria bacterium]|nr:sigma-70 family RNA polymerase sigma factor [Candidatus Poribacteria bacterium]